MLHKNTKVIQFIDSGQKRRIENNMYPMRKEQLNPQKEIELCTIEDLPILNNQGLSFNPSPDMQKGVTTYVQNPINAKEFIYLENYGDKVVGEKEKILSIILGYLGIQKHEYKINTQVGAGFGKKKGRQTDAGLSAEYNGLGVNLGYNRTKNDSTGLHAKVCKSDSKKDTFENFVPTDKHWLEACKLAKENNMYDSLIDIIELRKPGDNPRLLTRKTRTIVYTEVNANLHVASSLKLLLGCKALSGNFGKLNESSFEAYVNYKCETEVIFDFTSSQNETRNIEALDSAKNDGNKEAVQS